MKKDEALEWAADYAKRAGIFDPVTNGRGYSDGWKPPTPGEKARIISELADQVVDTDMVPKSLVRTYLVSAIGSVDDTKVLSSALKNLDSLLEKGDY